VVVDGGDGSKSYVSVARFEPIGSALAMAADAAEMWAGRPTTHEKENLALIGLESFLRNATSKTYVAGISDFMRVLNDPAYLRKWVQRTAATAAVPAAVNQFATSSDDELREARTILEAIKRRTPGMSETLPPRRNFLGEPITPMAGYVPFVDVADPLHKSQAARMLSPAALSRKSDDPVIQELATLRHGLTQVPTSIQGLDLTLTRTQSGQQAYDRFQELVGEVAPGGINVHDALKTLVSSPAYQALPPAPKDPTDNFNPRLQAVMKVLGRYRELAKRTLVSETPELRQHLIGTMQERSGKMEAAAALLERLKQ
jgi:hypothetical protein